MAVYNKFQVFAEEVCEKVHNLGSDALKLGLTNVSPNVADTHLDTALSPDVLESTSNATEIAAGNGYTEGGEAVTVTTSSQVAGTYTLAANQVVWTAVTGSMATFRYVYLYNNTGGAAATRPIIAWWDYASGVTLAVGETFTVKFNNANPGTIFTLT
jgi:hypothetical protein